MHEPHAVVVLRYGWQAAAVAGVPLAGLGFDPEFGAELGAEVVPAFDPDDDEPLLPVVALLPPSALVTHASMSPHACEAHWSAEESVSSANTLKLSRQLDSSTTLAVLQVMAALARSPHNVMAAALGAIDALAVATQSLTKLERCVQSLDWTQDWRLETTSDRNFSNVVAWLEHSLTAVVSSTDELHPLTLLPTLAQRSLMFVPVAAAPLSGPLLHAARGEHPNMATTRPTRAQKLRFTDMTSSVLNGWSACPF